MRFPAFLIMALFLFASTAAEASYETGIEAYRDGDFETARQLLGPVAEEGDDRAQLAMGLMYHRGQGGRRDMAEAVRWYRAAAIQGNRTAENNLGVMYRRGNGVEQDLEEAFALIWSAAIQGHPRAELNLADMYRRGEGIERNLVLAYVWLEFAITDLPASGRQIAIDRRDDLLAEMTSEDIQRAEMMSMALRKARE